MPEDKPRLRRRHFGGRSAIVFPELLRIGPVSVHSYGTLLMLGFLASIWLASRQARRLGLPGEIAIDLGLWALVGGVIFARALFAGLNWSDYAADPKRILYIWREGGLSFHGGLLGGVVAGALLAHRRRVSFWTLTDVAAPALALGYAIGRIGCLLNGCCYGTPTSLAWGLRFPFFPGSGLSTQPSHPTQVYSSLGSLLILAILLKARGRLRAPGQLFCLYLALYSVMRGAIEVLRRDVSAARLLDGITQAQVASGVILVGALITMLLLAHRPSAELRRRQTLPAGPWEDKADAVSP